MVNKLDRSREGNSAQVTFRADQKLLTALDAEVDRLRTERPGARVQRSDVVREILGRALLRGHTSADGLTHRGETPPPLAVATPPAGSPMRDGANPPEGSEDVRTALSPASTTRTTPTATVETRETQGGRSSKTSPERMSGLAMKTPPDFDDADNDDDEEAEVSELTRRLGRVPREHPYDVYRSKVLKEYYLEACNKRGFERAEIARETDIPAEVLSTFGEKKPLSDEHRVALVHWFRKNGIGPKGDVGDR